MTIRFEALISQDRSQFASGQTALDEWFRQRAGQDQRRGVTRVVVAVDDVRGIVGFYSLSSFGIVTHDLPEALRKRLPRYDLTPVILVGRLARDIRTRGEGIGQMLLGDLILRVAHASEYVGVFAIVVDGIDAHAEAFYRAAGFQRLSGNENRLFIPLATAATGLAEAMESRSSDNP